MSCLAACSTSTLEQNRAPPPPLPSPAAFVSAVGKPGHADGRAGESGTCCNGLNLALVNGSHKAPPKKHRQERTDNGNQERARPYGRQQVNLNGQPSLQNQHNQPNLPQNHHRVLWWQPVDYILAQDDACNDLPNQLRVDPGKQPSKHPHHHQKQPNTCQALHLLTHRIASQSHQVGKICIVITQSSTVLGC